MTTLELAACVFVLKTVEANDAKTVADHDRLTAQRDGMTIMASATFANDIAIGYMLMAADQYYIDRGIDRPMCGGLWLDWEAST